MKPLVALAPAFVVVPAAASNDALPLPPMGFNNWARYLTNISEGIFVDAAESMAKNGMLAAGYNRINLDDAWSLLNRTSNGTMAWDPKKFPKGLPWLTKHLKVDGFIPGIYTDSGTMSCGDYPGAEGHEEVDYKTFQSWGFEYLKVDGCYVKPQTEQKYHELYTKWYDIEKSSKNPMIFSDSAPAYFSGAKNLTDWYLVMGWASEFGQLARHSADIQTYPDGDSWKSMLYNYNQQVRLARYQKPGFFNDPDFINYDHPSYSLDEKKSHFALWCSLSAPLILSADIPASKPEEIEYLTNKDLIAVNQDELVQQATLVSRSDSIDVLSKSLKNGDRLVTVLNNSSGVADVIVSWERIGLSSKAIKGSELSAKDLWTGKTTKIAANAGGLTVKALPKHATSVHRISKPKGPITPTGIIINTLSMKCLSDSTSGKVIFADCDGSDGQTWTVESDGRINSLLRPTACIGNDQGKLISSESACQSNVWSYHISGNLIDGESGNCLTGESGSVSVTPCGRSLNEQVVALPVGVVIKG